jgi:hypothetical protein
MNLGVFALGAVQVRLAGAFRADGEGRDLLFEVFALAAGAGGGCLQDQRLKLLPAV